MQSRSLVRQPEQSVSVVRIIFSHPAQGFSPA
jgi:hypothetical protein